MKERETKMKKATEQESTMKNEGVGIDIQNVRLIHRDDTNTKAHMSAVIGGSYAVHGIKIVAGQNGDFVSMPNYRAGNGEYKEIVHPITVEARNELYGAVRDAYNAEVMQKQGSGSVESAQEEGAASDGQESEPEEGPSMSM